MADHLVPTTRLEFTQYDDPPFVVPAGFPLSPRDAGTMLRDILLLFAPSADLTPDDLAFFGARIWQILTSCHERRLGEYERTSWWEFIGAEQRSAAYQKFLATGITRSLVAAKARKASTRTIGDIFVQLVLTILNPIAGSTDRVLDGPTNLVWIDPWLAYLESSGVQYVKNAEVEEILCESGRITGVVARQQGEAHRSARRPLRGGAAARGHGPPGEQRPRGSRPDARQPARAGRERGVDERRAVLSAPRGAVGARPRHSHRHRMGAHEHLAAPVLAQRAARGVRDDSDVHGILSVDISDWTAPGSNGRPAMQCSREEVVRETWNQLKRSINDRR